QQCLGDGRRRAQRHEGIECAVVLPRKLTASGGRGATIHRDVRMLGQEQRVETTLLQGTGERGRPDSLVGDEGRDSELHVIDQPRSAVVCSRPYTFRRY